MATDISCIVVNPVGSDDMLNRFLESFLYQDSQAELIIVDMNNECSDKSVRLINSIDDCQYFSVGNIGLGRAYNIGGMYAVGQTLAFFTSDTVLFDDTLEGCSAALGMKSAWGVLSPVVASSSGIVTEPGMNTKLVKEVNVSCFFMKDFVFDDCCKVTGYVWPYSGMFLPSYNGLEGKYLAHIVNLIGYDVAHYGDCLIVRDPSGFSFSKSHMVEAEKIMRYTLEELREIA